MVLTQKSQTEPSPVSSHGHCMRKLDKSRRQSQNTEPFYTLHSYLETDV